MKLKTSRNKEYEVKWAGGPTINNGAVFLEMEDERRLPEIAAEFDGLDWLERISEDQGDKRFEGFSRLVGINETKGGVTIELAKEG